MGKPLCRNDFYPTSPGERPFEMTTRCPSAVKADNKVLHAPLVHGISRAKQWKGRQWLDFVDYKYFLIGG